MGRLTLVAFLAAAITPLVTAVASQDYTWKNVKIGGGGGFVPNIIFNPSEKGLAYARTDIGGAYKLNPDDSWTPLLDFADNDRWNYWGVDALATDPVDPNRLYMATGMYTNSWDPNNGQILISADYGNTFTVSNLSFKVGGNMPGRGMGERLAVDPNKNNVLFFGARSGNGLWKSTDYGATWTKVSSFPDVGTYIPSPGDSNDYNTDKVGIAFVTFDSTSGTSGTATPRIFVGVASTGQSNIFVSNDGGSTWSAVEGQITTFLPHKGILSPAEKALYVSYSDGAGPYDGENGAVYKYDIASSTWTDITPVSGGDLYFGFGGLTVDLQKPGTLMVAALNSWWPDGQIFRSTDSGASWSPLWSWASSGYPNIDKWYKYDNTLAPWLGPSTTITELGTLQIGWMMEGLAIDPFDSNHWLYGTGATIYGGDDLLQWDTTHNVTIKSLADGLEETSIQNLISPPSGPVLLSAIGDIQGFVHNSLTTAPAATYKNPEWSTASDIDYAGNKPSNVVRVGTGNEGKQVALSSDSGATWSPDYGAADGVSGGKIALSADGDTVLWRTSGNGVLVSQHTNPFQAVSSLPSDAAIASDKRNNSIFYGASGNRFYISRDGGQTFTSPATLGDSTAPFKIIAHPTVSGDVWVSSDKGIFHSTDFGSTFAQITGPTQAWAIALGAPANTGSYLSLYAAAKFGTQTGYFRSDDAGVNWVQINDASLGFGALSANCMAADLRTYGRVYVGTNGRGIFYGDASGTPPPATSTPPTTTPPTTTPPTTTPPTTTPPTTTPPTTTPPTTTPATTQPPTTPPTTNPPTATAGPWGQCGGNDWTGPTACPAGWTCTYNNPWYSQCLQN